MNLYDLFRSVVLWCIISLSSASLWAQPEYSEKIHNYIKTHYEELGLPKEDNVEFVITDNFLSKHNGVRHVYISQTFKGLNILNAVANIAMDKMETIVIATGRLIPGSMLGAVSTNPALKPKSAILKACEQLDIRYDGKIKLLEEKGAVSFLYGKGEISREDIPVELVFWSGPENELRLAWSMSIYTADAEHWWHVIIDATTGVVLQQTDWVVHCSHFPYHSGLAKRHFYGAIAPKSMPLPLLSPDSYNVYPLPVESPSHGSRSLVLNPADPNSSPFGWHDTDGSVGAEYTITRGNNVYAYEDRQANNSPGFSPDGGSTLDFDFPINLSADPSTYQEAAITNLFFTANRVHDICYRYGFDETSGNFQFNNYGNGGIGGDEVICEAQDGEGTNNANFATPPEGSTPRLQMYLWGAGSAVPVTVNTPAVIAGTYQAVGAAFGGAIPATPLTADVVLVNDNTGPDPNDACEPLVNGSDLVNKIALINRRDCQFVFKVQAAQDAGAVAVIMINNVSGIPVTMGGSSNTITIPSVMISMSDGQLLVNQLNSGDTVNATIQSSGSNLIDGDLDNGVVIHEYGHGISTRLTGGASNSSCLDNAEQMGEGWSDWFACMMTIDLNNPNPVNRPMASFASGNPITGPGIRNEPYDTSFAVNDYTYGDISNTGLLSQPHGIGFVWCTMLWDLTWAFMDQYGVDGNLENGTGGDDIVMQLVIDGLKLQPCNPGFVDARDAILTADQLNNGGINQCLIWKVFAKRGLGFSADQGSAFSRSDQTEAFDIPTICQNATAPPVALFEADTTSTCSGLISFTDQSTDIPQKWYWDFGDGARDSVPSPQHQYDIEGLYTVTLVVSNTVGADTLKRVNYIAFNPPAVPNVTDGIGCTGDAIELTASGSGTIRWFDNGFNYVGTGPTCTTPPLSGTTSYYVLNEQESPTQHVGPVDENFATGGYHNTAFTGTVNFTTEKALTILSAWINAGSAGARDVTLWDQFDGSGNVLQVITINPNAGQQRVSLGFDIPGPGNYSIGLNNADLYRNNAGSSYPYTIPGLISLVSSSATTGPLDYYYYFYDWEVKQPSCFSDTVAVAATVIDSLSFSFIPGGLTVDFSFTPNSVTNWVWDFGDGSTSTQQNPSHTYTEGGLYTVTLTAGSCSATKDISLGISGIGTQLNNEEFKAVLYPNPTRDYIVLSVSNAAMSDIRFKLLSVDGQIAADDDFVLKAGLTKLTIPLAGLSPGMYWLISKDYVAGIALKLVVIK